MSSNLSSRCPVRSRTSSPPPPSNKSLSSRTTAACPAFFSKDTLCSDNLKSAVGKAHRYEPDINPTYQDFAAHYGLAVILVKRQLDVRLSASTVEVFHHGRRVAPHVRSLRRGGCTTVGDPTLADAILDRLVHCAYKLTLSGESLRKQAADLTHEPALG